MARIARNFPLLNILDILEMSHDTGLAALDAPSTETRAGWLVFSLVSPLHHRENHRSDTSHRALCR